VQSVGQLRGALGYLSPHAEVEHQVLQRAERQKWPNNKGDTQMRHLWCEQLLVISLAFLFYASPADAQQPANLPGEQAVQDTASAELVKLTNAWTGAAIAKDHAKLEALLAPEFALYRWDGAVMAPRSEWLDNVDHIQIKELTVRDISARAYGEFAVVTSHGIWAGADDRDRRPFNFHVIIVDTWRRTNGKWQAVARSSCRLNSDAASAASPCALPGSSR